MGRLQAAAAHRGQHPTEFRRRGTPDGYGVWVFVPYLAPTVDHNTITNCSVGLSIWGQGAPVTEDIKTYPVRVVDDNIEVQVG